MRCPTTRTSLQWPKFTIFFSGTMGPIASNNVIRGSSQASFCYPSGVVLQGSSVDVQGTFKGSATQISCCLRSEAISGLALGFRQRCRGFRTRPSHLYPSKCLLRCGTLNLKRKYNELHTGRAGAVVCFFFFLFSAANASVSLPGDYLLVTLLTPILEDQVFVAFCIQASSMGDAVPGK